MREKRTPYVVCCRTLSLRTLRVGARAGDYCNGAGGRYMNPRKAWAGSQNRAGGRAKPCNAVTGRTHAQRTSTYARQGVTRCHVTCWHSCPRAAHACALAPPGGGPCTPRRPCRRSSRAWYETYHYLRPTCTTQVQHTGSTLTLSVAVCRTHER